MDARTAELLRLTLIPGLGPVRISRLMRVMGSADRVLGASAAALSRVPGIGPKTAGLIAGGREKHEAEFEAELERVEAAGARVVSVGGPGYPSLLSALPGAPPVLYVCGEIQSDEADRFPVSIVGSRSCTAYGIEQAELFGGSLARAGMTVISGGARGIDTAAHRGALRAGGRTVAVLGCGLGRCYPPENRELFDAIADGQGAVVSELPMATEPDYKNFPARNRLISGMSLGVVVIEAAKGSGALITARHAAEDHGREVMAVPGRVDSPASEGSLGLLRQGGAHLVTSPSDVIAVLEQSGWHADRGTLGAFTPTTSGEDSLGADPAGTGTGPSGMRMPPKGEKAHKKTTLIQPESAEGRVLETLTGARTMDQVISETGLSAAECGAAVTHLELLGVVRRTGFGLERRC
jgi:DNA processing protein